MELPPHPSPCTPVSSCHFCKLNGVEIEIKKRESLHDCGRCGRAPSFSPFHTHTDTHIHTHSHEERENTLSPVLCSASKPDIVGFTQKEKRWRKREESEGKKKRGGRGGERREGGKKTSRSTQKMLTFGSPQLSPPVKIGGVRFRGLLLCVTRQRKGGGKKKNVIRRGVTRQSLPRFVSWSGCKTSVVNLP